MSFRPEFPEMTEQKPSEVMSTESTPTIPVQNAPFGDEVSSDSLFKELELDKVSKGFDDFVADIKEFATKQLIDMVKNNNSSNVISYLSQELIEKRFLFNISLKYSLLNIPTLEIINAKRDDLLQKIKEDINSKNYPDVLAKKAINTIEDFNENFENILTQMMKLSNMGFDANDERIIKYISFYLLKNFAEEFIKLIPAIPELPNLDFIRAHEITANDVKLANEVVQGCCDGCEKGCNACGKGCKTGCSEIISGSEDCLSLYKQGGEANINSVKSFFEGLFSKVSDLGCCNTAKELVNGCCNLFGQCASGCGKSVKSCAGTIGDCCSGCASCIGNGCSVVGKGCLDCGELVCCCPCMFLAAMGKK